MNSIQFSFLCLGSELKLNTMTFFYDIGESNWTYSIFKNILDLTLKKNFKRLKMNCIFKCSTSVDISSFALTLSMLCWENRGHRTPCICTRSSLMHLSSYPAPPTPDLIDRTTA